MTSPFGSQNFFTLFGLPLKQRLDLDQLDITWRKLAASVHPDRFASASPSEQKQAMVMATQINEAYQTLKDACNRARYLLSLKGVDTQEETNTAMPMDFLMAQMEWREAIEDAKEQNNIKALEQLSSELQNDYDDLTQELETALDDAKALDTAALLVRKLRFLNKLDDEISQGIEDLLD